ncbi:MAG: MFS transporter [Bacteroidia bacterium]|nr:MFS transporter [Bacteroidia bacterium]
MSKGILNRIVIVAALGYFVDIYDLVLFGMERVASLRDILSATVSDEEELKKQIAEVGATLLSWQMGGMLVGGLVWGILGDKYGRLSVLFGSIITYSLANIANGFVNDTFWYAVLRFISGFGLAGELGAGVTLVAETMKKEFRGIGTTIVASVGLFGAVVAGVTTLWINNWRASYFIGGGIGLLLLFMRIGVFESSMFDEMKNEKGVVRGNLWYILKSPLRLRKYLQIICIAVPVWFVMYFLVQFSPEMMRALGMQNPPKEARIPIMVAYMGITIGDVASGAMSQYLKSRRKVLLFFIWLTLILSGIYYMIAWKNEFLFYLMIFLIGFATGYWAVFMSSASELFGTNIRATVTTSVPNMVRGTVTLMTMANAFLQPQVGFFLSSVIVGTVVFFLALLSAYTLEETFYKDLNYTE